MFRLFRNSLLSSTLISIGKAFTMVLVICLLVNPGAISGMSGAAKTSIGILSVIFAGLALFSCFFSFSKVMLTAGFWAASIYFLAGTFLSGNASFQSTMSIPKVLPGGLMYGDIPDSTGNIFKANLGPASSAGLMDTLAGYVTAPMAEAASALNVEGLGLGSGGGGMDFSSGSLPDSAYFGKPMEKRSFYPVREPAAQQGGLSSILGMLPVK